MRALCAIIVGVVLLAAGDASAQPSGYTYRKSITIDRTKVGASGTSSQYLDNFPILVDITSDTSLETVANGGRVQSASGYDIVFYGLDTTTCNGSSSCSLAHEIEDWSATTGKLVAWVKVPRIRTRNVSNSSNSVIYMYYGNSSVSSSTESVSNVWDANFVRVYHFDNGSGTTVTDAKGVANASLTGSPAWSTGIGNALTFDGTNDYANMTTTSMPSGSGARTISMWIRPSQKWQGLAVFGTAACSPGGQLLSIELNNANPSTVTAYNACDETDNSSVTQNGSTWSYVAVKVSAVSTTVTTVANSTVTNGTIGDELDTTNGIAELGRLEDNTQYYNGRMDEVRISNTARSDDWLVTEYYTYNHASSAFYTLGSEEDLGGGGGGGAQRFGYRKSITIDRTKVGASGTSNQYLDNFPIMVSLTSDNNLRTTGNGGRVTSASGHDIIFRATDATTCSGVTKYLCGGGLGTNCCTLSHEIETYNASTGQLVAWVKVPRIRTLNASNGSNTVIYMYYGNSDITSSTQDVAGVWDSNFVRVYHFKEGSGTSVDDAKDVANASLTGSPAWTTRFGNALTFDGSNDYANMTTTSMPTGSGNRSFSAWIRMAEEWEGPVAWFGGSSSCTSNRGSVLHFGVDFTELIDQTGCGEYLPGLAVNATGTWQYVAMTYAGGTAIVHYVNPTGSGTSVTLPGTLNTAFGTARLGANNAPDVYWKGNMDEARVSNSARTADWIVTEYRSGNHHTSAFFTLGSEESAPVSAALFQDADAIRISDGRTFLGWRTGLEIETLGFHVWRERAGQRERITPALLAGSLITFGRAPSNAPWRSYGFWDPPAPADLSAAPTFYWVEEVDARGGSTMHGPVTPTASAAPMALPTTPFLHELGAGRPGAVTGAPALALAGGESATSPIPDGVYLSAITNPQPWDLLSRRAVKLEVTETGLHRVDGAALAAAGLAGVDPRRLVLLADGKARGMRVIGGENGRLDAGDAVEFYGTSRDDIHEGRSLYWLMERPAAPVPGLDRPAVDLSGDPLLGGATDEPGRDRMLRVPSPPGFLYKLTHRDRSSYFGALLNGEQENFFGALITPAKPTEVTLDVHHRVPGAAEETLSVSVQGVSLIQHRIRVLLNGTEVGTMTFLGREKGTLIVPTRDLRDGPNTIRFEPLVPEGTTPELSMLDRVEITYRHAHVADGDTLALTAVAGQPITVSGFSSADVRALDVTASGRHEELPVTARREGSGHSVTVHPRGRGPRRLLLVTRAAQKRPRVIPAGGSSLDVNGGADLLVIGPGELLPGVQALRVQRERQGLVVLEVDVQAIYDGFSFGHKSPQAIRDYLHWATAEWTHRPKYVLLVGDGSFDPRNHLKTTVRDLLPVPMVETKLMETASDDWYVDFDGDEHPELAIGRLPARSVDEVRLMAAKIVDWRGVRGPGMRDAVFIAGTDEKNELDFEGLNRRVFQALPQNLRATELLAAGADVTELRTRLFDEIALGPLVVNYAGHGSAGAWSSPSLMSLDQVGKLPQPPRLPVFSLMTCLNNYFEDVYTDSIGEALLRAPSGGVAAYGSSGLTEPKHQEPLNKALLQAMFGGQARTIGDAVLASKRAATDREVRVTWLLLGDPSMPLDPDSFYLASEYGAAAGGCSVGAQGGAGGLGLVLVLLALAVRRRRR